MRQRLSDRVIAQGGLCRICAEPLLKPCVDMDWNKIWEQGTRAYRGLLCTDCNSVVAHGRDDPERLRRAAIYLEGHRES